MDTVHSRAMVVLLLTPVGYHCLSVTKHCWINTLFGAHGTFWWQTVIHQFTNWS